MWSYRGLFHRYLWEITISKLVVRPKWFFTTMWSDDIFRFSSIPDALSALQAEVRVGWTTLRSVAAPWYRFCLNWPSNMSCSSVVRCFHRTLDFEYPFLRLRFRMPYFFKNISDLQQTHSNERCIQLPFRTADKALQFCARIACALRKCTVCILKRFRLFGCFDGI